MAFENVGLVGAVGARAALALTGGDSVRVVDGQAAGEPFLRFRTMQGAGYHAAFDVALMWQGVPRATESNGATVYGSWSTARKRVPSSAASTGQSNGMTDWAIPLSAVAGPKGLWSSSASWQFADRLYDELHFRGTVTPYGAGGAQSGPAGAFEAWIGWMPRYEAVAADFGLDWVEVELSRSPGWLRTDDRWCLTGLAFSGHTALAGAGEVWGHVGSGLVRIPISSLTRRPSGASVDVGLRVNASYKPVGAAIAVVDGTLPMADHSTCDTPAVSASQGGAVRVSDSGDKGVPFERATVKLRGSSYTFDTVDLTSFPGTARFVLPPQEATYDVTAGADGALSATVSASARQEVRGMELYDFGTGEVLELDMGPSLSVDFTPAATVEKLAGRELESVWEGTGGSMEVPVSFTILGEDAGARALKAVKMRRCLLRTPDGLRQLCEVTKGSWSHAPGRADVSLTLKGVAE